MSDPENEDDPSPGPNNYQFTPSTTDKIFNCGQCDFSYSTIKQIMVHVRSSPNHESVCVQCNGRYKSFDKLRAHLRKIHFQVGEVICNDCGKVSKTKDQHEQHYNQVHRVEKDLFCNLCGVECQNMIKLRKHTKLCLNKDPMKSERERMENSRVNNCKTQEVLLTLEKYMEYQKNLELQKLAKIMASPKKRMKLANSVKNETADEKLSNLLLQLQKNDSKDSDENDNEENDCSDEDEHEFLENIKQETKPKQERELSPKIEPEMLLEVKCEEPSDEELDESQDYDFGNGNEYDDNKDQDDSNQDDSNFPIFGEDSLNEEDDDDEDEDDFDPRYFAATSLQEEDIKKEDKPKCIYANADGKCTYQHECPQPQHPCGLCEQKFHSKTEVRNHMREDHTVPQRRVKVKHEKESKYSCSQCDGKFQSNIKLKTHMIEAHQGSFETFNCNLCSKTFFNEKSLKSHFGNKHPETVGPRKCVWCEDVVKNLRKHRLDKHADIMALIKKSVVPSGACICPMCGKQISTQPTFETHLRKVHGEILMKVDIDSTDNLYCEDCGQVYDNARDLWLHRKQTHDHGKEICPICGKLESRDHIKNFHNIQPVKCEICFAEMKNKTALRKHKNSVHAPAQEVTCDECGKMFENKVKLYHHTYTTHNNQESKCEWCGGTYKNKKLLQAHKRVMHKNLYIGRDTPRYKPSMAMDHPLFN